MMRMTAKQYLRKMFYFQKSILKKREKIEELRLLAESTGAIRYDKEHVITSLPQTAGYEDKVVKIVDLEHKLLEDIAQLTEMYEVGDRMINSLDNPTDRLILTMRYINHMRWEEIAQELSYSVDHVYYRHRHAIKKIKDNSFYQYDM